eukprot:GHVR01071839.1.p1 GENE.GHVR01071839.1~~GHVR01071839.1.p1  ORF type:complete len:156 (+),score=22.33 GHVR01071839.1:3-470(+)
MPVNHVLSLSLNNLLQNTDNGPLEVGISATADDRGPVNTWAFAFRPIPAVRETVDVVQAGSEGIDIKGLSALAAYLHPIPGGVKKELVHAIRAAIYVILVNKYYDTNSAVISVELKNSQQILPSIEQMKEFAEVLSPANMTGKAESLATHHAILA